jgi:hypothetical protein
MRTLKLLALLSIMALSGCVLGYGRCLFLEPVKSSLAGTVHFREFPADNYIDRVPVLTLDRTEYIYNPAQSRQCRSAHEVQLAPIADLPEDIAENAHVVVEGALVDATQAHQHTRFVLNVASIRMIKKP